MSDIFQDTRDPEVSLGQIYTGVIVQPPITFRSMMAVVIPDMHPDLVHHNVKWQARDNMSFPQIEDKVLVIFDNNNDLWAVAWWPAERNPMMSIGDISDGPPADCVDGDIWYANVGNGIRWQFQYNAESSSPYKWEFVGGSDLEVDATADYTIPNGWAAAPAPRLTIPRDGDYAVQSFLDWTQAVSNNDIDVWHSPGIGSAISGSANLINRSTNDGVATNRNVTTITGTPVDLRYWMYGSAAGVVAKRRYLIAKPVRIT